MILKHIFSFASPLDSWHFHGMVFRSSQQRLTPVQCEIVKEIKRLYRCREPLNISAVKRNHLKLIQKTYSIQPFWGWKQAIQAAGIDYAKIKVELKDHVICELCGRELGGLSFHLKAIHGITPEEYCWDYPAAEIVCEEVRARMKGISKGKGYSGGQAQQLIPHWEPIWTAEYVLDRLAELHARRKPISSKAVYEHEPSLVAQAKHYFGSWDAAIQKIGIEPLDIRQWIPRTFWTKEIVIRELHNLQHQGHSLLASDIAHSHSALIEGTRLCFGSHQKALKAAGLFPWPYKLYLPRVQRKMRSPRKPEFSTDACNRMLNAIRETARTRGDAHVNAVRELRTRYKKEIRYFYGSSWAKAARDAGVGRQAIRTSPLKYPLRTDVINEIKARHKQRLPLHFQAVHKGVHADTALAKHAKKRFGTWDAALKAAGLDVLEIRKQNPNPYPRREDVIREIRRRRREKRPLNSHELTRGKERDNSLHSAAKKLWGSWAAAIQAASLNYADITQRGRRKYPNPEDVLKAIRKRRREKRPLNAQALSKGPDRDGLLYSTGCKLFGSWRKAIEAAGLSWRHSIPPRGPYAHPEAVIREIKRRVRLKLPLNPGAIHKEGNQSLLYYAKTLFGSWQNAISAAGMEFSNVPGIRTRYPGPESIIETIQRLHREGVPLSMSAMQKDGPTGKQLYHAACRLFGNWTEALRAAGLDPASITKAVVNPYKDSDAVLRVIRKRHRQKQPLSASALKQGTVKEHQLANAARKFFGNWSSALQAAGLDSDRFKARRGTYPTPGHIIRELKRRKRQALPIHSNAIANGAHADLALLNAARRKFGSWPAALKAAGIDPDKVSRRGRKYPTPKDILSEIRRRRRRKQPLHLAGIRKGIHRDSGLYIGALREFGSWKSALKKAGINLDFKAG